MKDSQDAYGHELLDHLQGFSGHEIVERDDGHFSVNLDTPQVYFSQYKDWMPNEKKAIRFARGRVLDIGCGAGRMMLYLKQKGLNVMGIDISPLAIEVCKKRGLKNVRVLSITQVDSKLGFFDTILLFGGNFGLFGNPKRAKWLLKRFHRMTSDEGRIIAVSCNPYMSTSIDNREYRVFNRGRGRRNGYLRFRIRYRKFVTPWQEWLLVSQKEMRSLLMDSGWKVKRLFGSPHSPAYYAIIDKRIIR